MNEEIITGTSSKNIKMDLLRFKDDILKDIRVIELGLNKKCLKTEESVKEKISKFDLKIASLEQKIFELSNLITTDNLIKEKIESLNQFKEEMRDTIFKRRAKYNEFEKMVNDEINRINNILMDSVIYPGIIGPSTKFKTFHDFIDYLLMEINQLIFIKDKNGLDFIPYKKKIDQSIDAFRIQINNLSSKQYLFNAINESEKKLKNLIETYDDRLNNIKNENYNNIKKIEEMSKQIEILLKLKYLLNEKENENNLYNNEIILIKNDINNINELLKELLSYHPSFIKDIEKKSSKIYSGVKQYINGHLNANELSSMKKFTYEKSKSSEKSDKNKNSIKTSPFPSSPSSHKLNNNFELKKNVSDVGKTPYILNKNNDKIDMDALFFISQRSEINKSDKSDLLNRNDKGELFNENEKETENENKIIKKGYNLEDTLYLEINSDKNKIINDFKENGKSKESTSIKNNNLEFRNNSYNIKKDLDKCVIKEEDENALSDNSKNKLDISYIDKKYENKIEMNKNFLKENINKFNIINNNLYEVKNNNLNINEINKTPRILNISKKSNYYQVSKPYKMELIKNKQSPSLEAIDLNNNKYNIPNNESSKNEKNNKININIKKTNDKNLQTYTYFPKLNKELSENKIKLLEDSTFQKNYISFRNINNIGNIGESSKSEVKVAGDIKRPKKILLTSPDNIPLNGIIRKNKRRKSFGFFTEKNRDKQIKRLNEDSIKNKNKNHFQSYSSLCQMISSQEESFTKKIKGKNQK